MFLIIYAALTCTFVPQKYQFNTTKFALVYVRKRWESKTAETDVPTGDQYVKAIFPDTSDMCMIIKTCFLHTFPFEMAFILQLVRHLFEKDKKRVARNVTERICLLNKLRINLCVHHMVLKKLWSEYPFKPIHYIVCERKSRISTFRVRWVVNLPHSVDLNCKAQTQMMKYIQTVLMWLKEGDHTI